MRTTCGSERSVPARWIAIAIASTLLTVVEFAAALDITSRPVRELDGPDSKRMRLVLSGPIEPGDAPKLERVLATLPLEQFDGVVLHSPGGVSFEGHRLGELLEHFLVRVIVRAPFRCASACFTMYAGAAMRGAHGPPQPPTLAVHRGSLHPDDAANLSTEKLERLLAFEQDEKPRWLMARGVPPHIVDHIVSGPVVPIVVLSQQDIDEIGPRSPGYDAWIEARCPGSGRVAAWTVREIAPQVVDAQLAHAEERRQCETKRVDAERRYRQSQLQTVLDARDRRDALRWPATVRRAGGAIGGR